MSPRPSPRRVSKFLSTPSARRATYKTLGVDAGKIISIHALREEGDLSIVGAGVYAKQFLSTPSARRATPRLPARVRSTLYFYPRPPRGGRLLLFQCRFHAVEISIHALREEGDPSRVTGGFLWSISIHALREEGDDLTSVYWRW